MVAFVIDPGADALSQLQRNLRILIRQIPVFIRVGAQVEQFALSTRGVVNQFPLPITHAKAVIRMNRKEIRAAAVLRIKKAAPLPIRRRLETEQVRDRWIQIDMPPNAPVAPPRRIKTGAP